MAITSYDKSSAQARILLNLWHDGHKSIKAHTSGSTGRPKEIQLEKSDMYISAKATCDFFGITERSNLFLPLSADYIAGIMMIVRAEISGANLITETPSLTPMHTVPDTPIDLASVVPAQLPHLLSSDKLDRVDSLLIGGAPLPKPYELALLKRMTRAHVTYGMTETCSHVALRKVGTSEYLALPHVWFETDESRRLIINSKEMSFGRLVTNDTVNLISPTKFEWLGRADNVINSGGIKIIPEVVEGKLHHLFAGREFYITSRQSNKWGEEVILMVEGTEPLDYEIFKSIEFAKGEKPKDIIYVKQFTRTPTGKIIRRKYLDS